MELNHYQEEASKTATFDDFPVDPIVYLTLGLTGESGEVAEKIKKMFRNDNGILSDEKKEAIKYELGDVLWYISQLARTLGYTLDEVAEANITKLADRKARGVLKSEGDNR